MDSRPLIVERVYPTGSGDQDQQDAVEVRVAKPLVAWGTLAKHRQLLHECVVTDIDPCEVDAGGQSAAAHRAAVP